MLAVLCALLVSSCNETLPPFDTPQDYLVANTACDYYNNPRGAEEAFYVTLKVRNAYTEVLSDKTTVYGTLTIIWNDHPEFQRHVDLTSANLLKQYFNPITGLMETSRADYNAVSKVLTIPEEEFAVFQFKWDMRADNLTDLRTLVTYHPDRVNPSLFLSEPLTFTITAGVHLYDKVPMIYARPLVTVQQLKRVQQ